MLHQASEITILLERKSCKHKLQTQSDTSLVPFGTIAHVPFIPAALALNCRTSECKSSVSERAGGWPKETGWGVGAAQKWKGEISLFGRRTNDVLCLSAHET